MSKHFTVPALVAALALGANAQSTSTSSMGSFVSGERPYYLELDQFSDGAPFTAKFMNLPEYATELTLYISPTIVVAKHPDSSCPGTFGIEIAKATAIKVSGSSYSGTVDAKTWNGPVYVQGYFKTAAGGRLTSLVEVHPDEALTSDPAPTVTLPIPLLTQEVLRAGKKGFDRAAAPVRVGVPFPKGLVFEKSGVPQLTLTGGPKEAQFSTLAKWSDGSCKWVLAEYRADVLASVVQSTVKVDKGVGNFGGSDLASTSGTVTTIDTGSVKLTIDSTKSDLFQSVIGSGRDLISTSAGNKPHYWDAADKEWTWHKTAVRTRRNGPVRSEVEVDGMFTQTTSATDANRVLVRVYLEAFKGSADVRATVSLRDTSVQFPEHLQFRGFTYRMQLNESGPFDVRMPKPALLGDATTLLSGAIASGQDASFVTGFVKRSDYQLQTDPNSISYKGFLLRNGNDNFGVEGVCARIASTNFCGSSSTNYFSPESEFCDPSFVEVNSQSSGRGVVFGVEHACRTWPVGLDAGGDGRIEVGLLPHKPASDTHLYPLTYASAETRTFWMRFESSRAADPIAVASSFDYPVAARAELFAYNQSEVWPWKLVSEADARTYQTFANIRTTGADTCNPQRTNYRFAGGTGGGNNNWEETRRFYHWLRTGNGGSFQHSLMEAYYKADKMAWNIDDGRLSDRQKIRNSNASVTRKSDMYDGSKHTFFQAVPDWAFARGETHLLDAAKPLAETILDKSISPNVTPNGNFVPATYGAVTSAACAVLQLAPNPELEDWLHTIMFQWSNVVFAKSNDFGVSTTTLGWQAPIGTPEGSATNPDGFMITWSAGKSSDKAVYGYMSQLWTDLRGMSIAYNIFSHHLAEKAPADPLLDDLLYRSPDIYHYAHRGLMDDHNRNTGDYYITDVFAGDAGNSKPNPLTAPGAFISTPNSSGYANQCIVNFLLDFRRSESAYSYGVELNRSMSENTYQHMVNDPILNDFIWRYLVHYKVIKP
ncbi:MAG: hypothetical protein EXS13_04550 [Planctomycetes bacterium]|nr:hypothetical protein [Planctomycetota bacterium]